MCAEELNQFLKSIQSEEDMPSLIDRKKRWGLQRQAGAKEAATEFVWKQKVLKIDRRILWD